MEERKKIVLPLSSYSDGISETEFYCIEIVTAALCGYQEYEYYYYYLLLKIVESNWMVKNQEFNIFKILGLRNNIFYVNNKDEFIKFVYRQIDLSLPIIIPVNYNALFFVEDYQKKDDIHFLLVNGYNKENDTLYLKLSSHIFTDPFNDNIGLYTLRITKDMLIDIWEKSCKSKLLNCLNLNNTLITIEKTQDIEVKCLYFITKNIIQNIDFKSSLFIKKITRINNLEGKDLREFLTDLKISHEKYINSFFYILLYLLNKEKSCLDMIQNINKEWKEYIKKRADMIAEIQKKLQRKLCLDLDMYTQKVFRYDNKLKNLLVEINNQLGVEVDLYKNNIVKECKIIVSSEDETFFSPYNVLFDNEEIWRSSIKDLNPWMMLELPKQSCVKKLEIKHDISYNKTTMNFSIQVSNDKLNWTEVETVFDNNNILTSHYFANIRCQYIRINILVAGRYTNQARIRQIKLFGNIVEYMI